ncbi:unnamed protein product [Microthlaspi erraticum]|uniref:Eisosome protein SEG2 n=1 Tax=Microthlaspi erraticum TaxID=1685480 RepID=A0A6D2HU67_9BRAS|nr:unnamed protein product [Microthlaspi erraticum]
MGCLPGCFGRRKNRRRQSRRESFQPRLNKLAEGSTKDVHLNLRVPIVEKVSNSAKDDHHLRNVVEIPKIPEDRINFRLPTDEEEAPKISVIPITDICDKAEEKQSPSPARKRVTFDSNVKTYEHIAVEESNELFEEKKEEVKKQGQCSSEGSDITSNSSGSYPSNHRYQNCRDSDDEVEDVTDCDESDLEDDDDDELLCEEDYYNDDGNYEAKLHNWDKEVYTEEIADNVLDIERIEETSKGSIASGRDRSGYVNAVLNPIENLTQWKAVKSKGRSTTIQTQSRKENDQEHKLEASFSLPSSFSLNKKSRDDETKKERCQEVAVDASLSTWLSSSSQTTTSVSMGVETVVSEKKKCMFSYSETVQSYDERPILGALTSEEIKQFSATNSPRKSPSRSPESPITGTVGGYWNSHSMATRN